MRTKHVGLLRILLLIALAGTMGAWWLSHRRSSVRKGIALLEQAERQQDVSSPLQPLGSATPPRQPLQSEPSPVDGVSIRIVGKADGKPVAGASISVFSNNQAFGDSTMVTDGVGIVKLPLAMANGAVIEITAAGYVPIQQMLPDPAGVAVEYEVCTAGSIRVKVHDETGSPLEGALVTAFLTPNGISKDLRAGLVGKWPHFQVPDNPSITDESGERIITGMPCDVPLNVTASGVVPNTTLETIIDSSLKHRDVEMRVSTDTCLLGRLLWDTGEPVSEPIEVHCMEVRDPAVGPPKTSCDEVGRFKLCGIPTGRVNWRIDWPGEYSRCATIIRGALDVGDIHLRRAFECSGRVYLTGAPPGIDYKGVGIRCYHNGVLTSHIPLVDSDGTFRTRLPAGQVRLVLSVSREVITEEIATSPSMDMNICLDAFVGMLRIKNLQTTEGVPLTLKLEPVGDTAGSIDRQFRSRREYSSGGTESVLRVQEGDLRMWFAPVGIFDVYIREKEDRIRFAGRAEISAGRECVIDAAGYANGRISGIARTSEGMPVVGLEVECCLAAMRDSKQYQPTVCVTASDGSFSIPDVPPGNWLVYPQSRGSYSAEAQSVFVRSSSEAMLTLVIGQPGAVAGIVRGGQARSTSVTVRPKCERITLRVRPSYTMRASEDGRFALKNLTPGAYEVFMNSGSVRDNKRRVISRFIEVEAGKTTQCDFDLGLVPTQLVFQMNGVAWDGVDDGYMFSPDGIAKLERMPESPSSWGVRLNDGPCLFLLVSKDVPRLDSPVVADGFVMAYVAQADGSLSRLNVRIAGATILIRGRTADTVLPSAYLEDIGEFHHVSEFIYQPMVAHADEESTRRVWDVPVGSTITLRSDTKDGSLPQTQLLVIRSATQVEILWPPE